MACFDTLSVTDHWHHSVCHAPAPEEELSLTVPTLHALQVSTMHQTPGAATAELTDVSPATRIINNNKLIK